MIPNSPPEQPAVLFWSDESNYDDNIHGPSMSEEKNLQKFHVYVVSLVHKIFYS